MNEEAMRKAFEAHMLILNACTRLHRYSAGNGYRTVSVQRAWDLWQAATRAAASAWQPIETAPKDGTEVLLYAPATVFDGKPVAERITYGAWSEPSQVSRIQYKEGFAPEQVFDEWEPYWASWDGGFTETHAPTHWMPLPPAPEVKP